jgi:hypothetical protein
MIRDCENIGGWGGTCKFKQYVFAGDYEKKKKAFLFCRGLNASVPLSVDYMFGGCAQWHKWNPLTPDQCPMKVYSFLEGGLKNDRI